MKLTIKALLVALALSSVATGNDLTLKQIDRLYSTAAIEHHEDVQDLKDTLLHKYVEALGNYSDVLTSKGNLNAKNVAIVAAIRQELAYIIHHFDFRYDVMKPLPDGADDQMKSFRDIYNKESKVIVSNSVKAADKLQLTLFKQLSSLKSRLAEAGDVEGALLVHKRLVEAGVVSDVPHNTTKTQKGFMTIIRTGGGYARAKSAQKLNLKEDLEYTFTVFVKFNSSALDKHDCLPRFYAAGDNPFKGGEDNPMRVAQRASEKRSVVNAGDGWEKITVKFTHAYNEPVIFGVMLYESTDINVSLRDFSLTNLDGKELITKNLNAKSGWFSAPATFSKSN